MPAIVRLQPTRASQLSTTNRPLNLPAERSGSVMTEAAATAFADHPLIAHYMCAGGAMGPQGAPDAAPGCCLCCWTVARGRYLNTPQQDTTLLLRELKGPQGVIRHAGYRIMQSSSLSSLWHTLTKSLVRQQLGLRSCWAADGLAYLQTPATATHSCSVK